LKATIAAKNRKLKAFAAKAFPALKELANSLPDQVEVKGKKGKQVE